MIERPGHVGLLFVPRYYARSVQGEGEYKLEKLTFANFIYLFVYMCGIHATTLSVESEGV
jgi:hypothetical protein